MPHSWVRRIFIGLSVVALVSVVSVVVLSLYKISSVQERQVEYGVLEDKVKLARGLVDNVNAMIRGFTSITVSLEPAEREQLFRSANDNFEAFQRAVPKLFASSAGLLTTEKVKELEESVASIAHSWDEIQRQTGSDLTEEEKAYHFLKLQEDTVNVHELLRDVEAATTDAAADLTRATHESLRSVAGSLLWAMLLGAAVSIVACFGTIQFSRIIQSANATIRERDEEVLEKGRRLSVALENMMHGLSMFDRDKRLVVCNSQYATMYRLTPEQVQEGASLRSILDGRVAAETCSENHEEYRDRLMSEVELPRAAAAVDKLQDGRFISVSRQPMPNGGWVAIHQDITEQKRAEEKITHMAHHDALTGLPNRVFLRKELNRHLGPVSRGETFAVLCLDLDRFKQVNDTLGHSIGDALLSAVGRRLRECVRDTDVVARLGGDEFAIIQNGAEQPTSATILAQRLAEQLSKPFDVERHEIIIGTSIGIAVAPNDGLEPDQLLKSADMALYRAKEQGRNGFCFFESGMDAKMQERRTLETDLRKAIAAGEFELFYQPLVNLEANTVSGFEALLRWHHPIRGLVSPEAFIPLAEETGLIIPLGEWVLRQACAEAAKWPDGTKIAINLSPAQFRSKGLVATVMSAIATAGIAPNRVELEITETILLQNNEATLAVLHQLRRLGVRISMDDFGTGYSSLSYLRSFPFDKIKIDQSFVRDLDRNKDAIAIIRAITGLGVSLGMTTTIEGIETKEQLEQIRAEGCTEVQGYLFSRPRPASDVPSLLHALGRSTQAAA
jgi:diguanylate cyclase (GGDEF)-like protein/PAS domain S-box-containing protein